MPPSAAGAHGAQEALDVGDDGLGRPAGQHLLEMPAREPVLLLQEEGAREFEAHAHKLRAVHQDGAESGDGLVELLLAGLPVRDGMGGGERLHAGPEARAGRVLAEGGFRAPADRRQKQDQQAQNADAGEKPRQGVTSLPAVRRGAAGRAARGPCLSHLCGIRVLQSEKRGWRTQGATLVNEGRRAGQVLT